MDSQSSPPYARKQDETSKADLEFITLKDTQGPGIKLTPFVSLEQPLDHVVQLLPYVPWNLELTELL